MDLRISKSGQKIYIVEKHHEVLEAWEKYQGYNIITLDTHKDTQLCFTGKNLNREQGINDYKNSNKSIAQIIENLKNDEHIDFATSSGMIISSRVFVLIVEIRATLFTKVG